MITLRNTKGTPLTWNELDENFLYLDNKISEIPTSTTTAQTTTFMDIQYGYMSGNITSIGPSQYVSFAQSIGVGTLDYVSKVDDKTILIKAGTLYKFEGQVSSITDDDAQITFDVNFGLYSDAAGTTLLKPVDFGYEYIHSGTNFLRQFTSIGYIKSDVDCYLKGKTGPAVIADSTGVQITMRNTLTKYNTSPILTDANGSYTQGRQELPSYSSTETLTEKRWIDGKPIYRKVITYTPAVYNTSYTIDTSLTSINCQIINSNIIINNDTGQYDKVTSGNAFAYCGTGNAGVYFVTSTIAGQGLVHWIVLEYTKTNDTAGSPVALVGGVQDSFVSKFVGCSAYPSTLTQAVTANTAVKVLLDSVEYDTNSSFNSTDSKYIVPVSGYYTVNGSFNSSVSTNITIYIYVNGVSVKTGVNTTGTRCSSNSTMYLNKGDYVELYVYSTLASTIIGGKLGTYLQVSLIAPNYGGQNTLPNYSTTETLTSERWIDGKPIYRKVINAGGFTTNTTKNVAHNITGVDQIWIDEGNSFLRNGINSVPLNQVYSSDNITRVYLTTTSIMLYTNVDYSSYTTYVTICYTKTTDTESSPVTTIGGSGTPKKYFARIKNGTATTLNRTQGASIPLNTFVKGDSVMSNGTGFIAPQDDIYTIDFSFRNNNVLNININSIMLEVLLNGVLDDIFTTNQVTGIQEKGINGSLSTKLKKNDIITFRMSVWATDTTSELQIPVNSLVANIRN